MEQKNLSISNFNLFLVKILIPYILIISIGGLVINYIFENKIIFTNQNSGAYKINRIINETYPSEIAIFGSSRAEGAFIPDSLGRDYFNYGLSGTGYDVTLFFLEEECKKVKSNPFVILEIGLNGFIHNYGNISNYIPFSKNKSIRELLGKDYNFYFNIPLIKYFGQYEFYFKTYLNDKIQLTKIFNKGAALDKNILTSIQFNEFVELRKHNINYYVSDTVLKKRLFRIIQQYPKKYFIFVVTPYHNSCFENFNNIDSAKAFLEQLNNYNNVKVLNMARIQLTDDMFLNTSHINYLGARLFNRVLKDSIEAIYKIKHI